MRNFLKRKARLGAIIGVATILVGCALLHATGTGSANAEDPTPEEKAELKDRAIKEAEEAFKASKKNQACSDPKWFGTPFRDEKEHTTRSGDTVSKCEARMTALVDCKDGLPPVKSEQYLGVTNPDKKAACALASTRVEEYMKSIACPNNDDDLEPVITEILDLKLGPPFPVTEYKDWWYFNITITQDGYCPDSD